MKEYLPWISMAFTVIGFVIMYVKYVVQMEARIVTLETKVSLFWDSVGNVVKDILKQPIHFKKDDLIDRFPELSDTELEELRKIILEEVEGYSKIKDHKALAGAILLSEIENERSRRRTSSCSYSPSGLSHLLCRLYRWFIT